MGVHGLWDLLAPVGRRVSVETLAGKRLAIDASIWMVQFMKAMRDEKGEMVRNAHLLGFFRRICKLLFLRTKPVFVFDGATPALKRRTVIARRRQKENAQAKIRKTAEKLFLNQMKAMRLNNLAENLKGQKDMSKLKGKEIMVENSVTLREKDAALGVKNQEIVDEMLAASILAEECGELDRAVSPPAAPVSNASASVSTSTSKSASAAAITLEDEDGDDDEEMMMPITDGNVDPAVLAALPPSMQLDLLVQMRERLMAENRQKYQKVKKAPQKFSELQIEAYLKTVAFRREIDVVQKAAAGKEVGGVQTSRIASEANREFIFSSSFSGDKQALASSGAENYSEKQQGLEKRESSSDIGDVIAASASKSNAEAEPLAGEVETYLDDKGRKRIHRTRAMGIRMTRDLQRNIDLMKESEHDRTTANNNTNVRTELDSAVGPSETSDCEVQFVDAIEKVNCNHKSPQKSLLEIEACKDAPKTASSINISFCDDGKHMSVDDDDEFFSRLVAGSPVSLCSDDNSASDVEWEDGTNVDQSNHLVVGNKVETNVAWKEGSNICDGKLEAMKNLAENHKENEFESDWKKDGTNNFREVQEISVDVSKAVSKGSAEEEAALQDAIRRSLEDITAEKTSTNSVDLGKSNSGSNVFLLGSSNPQLTSTIGDFFLGNVPRQPFAIGNDQSSILAVKDAYAPSTSDRLSESAVDVTTTNLTTARSNENKLCFQHSETPTESVEIRNLSNDGSSEPTVTTFGNLSSSLQAPFDDVLTNEDTTTNLSDMFVGHGAPSTTVETSHDDIHRQIPEEDISFVSVLERGQDLKFTAPDDVDMNGVLLSASLEDELLELGKEFKDLENEQKKLERNADSVNSEMFVECQELLQMFGLPYIIAPMEAEAQCAFLETANLVDGVVTDDSDVFLFGAQSVFKNIFDDRKYVETYFLKDIESELGLNTEKLIRMGLLLGSDYTEGVSGIGIVNAIEVVNAFPEDNGLLKFREWVESPDPSILGKVGRQPGLSAKKNGSKGTLEADCNSSGENEDDEDTDSRKRKEFFMNKHRNVSKNWHIPASFPSDAVISAYKSPQVDKSAEPFAWGKPDIFSLRRLCSEKFSWVNQKADELLLPVLKEYNKHETQLRLEAFYSFNEKFANIRSKRVRQAVKGITGKRALANTDDSEELLKRVKKRGRNASDKGSSKKEDGPRKRISATKRPKSKKIGVEEGESMQMTDEAEETRVDSTGLSKARGRSGKAVRRGTRKDSSDSELDESSTYNLIGSSDAHDHVLQLEKTAFPLNVRRSKRARRTTCYVEKEEESDDLTMSPAMTSERCSNDTGQQILLEGQDALKTDSIDASRPQGVTSDDYFPGNGFCGDYLVEGGGFCADEDDVGLTSDWAGSIHCDGPHGASVDDDSEYLQMGGGFCTDDADEGLDILDCGGAGASTGTVADISVTPSKPHEAGHIVDEHSREVVPTLIPTVAPAPDGVQVLQNSPSFVSEVNPSEQHESAGIDPLNAGQTQAVGDHNTPAFVNPFGAIPFLKKKKRKP